MYKRKLKYWSPFYARGFPQRLILKLWTAWPKPLQPITERMASDRELTIAPILPDLTVCHGGAACVEFKRWEITVDDENLSDNHKYNNLL